MYFKNIVHELSAITEVLPSYEQIRALVDKHLEVSNTVEFDRASMVDRVSELLYSWAKKFGLKKALALLSMHFIDGVDDDKEGYRVTGCTGPLLKVQGTDFCEPSPWRCIQFDWSTVLPGKQQGDNDINRAEKGSTGGPGEGGKVIELSSKRPRDSSKEGLSRTLVELELQEHSLDLSVFKQAYDLINGRVNTVKDEGRLMKLVEWSGTTAVLCTLELVIHNVERVVAELRELLKKIDDGEITNID